MPDPFYPTVDHNFLEQNIFKSGKVPPNHKIKVGATTIYVLDNNKALHKRSFLLRELVPGEVSLELATACALKFNFLTALMNWLEVNKNWKDGAYFVP